jgi:hypothetical protein
MYRGQPKIRMMIEIRIIPTYRIIKLWPIFSMFCMECEQIQKCTVVSTYLNFDRSFFLTFFKIKWD